MTDNGKISYLKELEELAKLKEKNIITDKEFEEQKKRLLKESEKTNQQTSAPVCKKRSGCLWQTVKVAGIVCLLAIFGSCAKSCGRGRTTPSYVKVGGNPAPAVRTVKPEPNAGLKAVLAEQEEWRAEFNDKIKGFYPKTQEALKDGMTYLSAFQQYLSSEKAGDRDGMETARDSMNALKGKIKSKDPITWKSVEGVSSIMLEEYKQEGKTEFDFGEIGDGLVVQRGKRFKDFVEQQGKGR